MRSPDHALRGAVEANEQHPRWLRGRRRLDAAVLVERVVHRKLSSHVVEVIPADRLETRGGGIQASGLGGEAAIVGIRAADDLRECVQCRIGELVPVDERIERAQRAPVPELDIRNVVGNRILALRGRQYLFGRHEQELRLRIDESSDQPRAGYAIDPSTLASDPFHGDAPYPIERPGDAKPSGISVTERDLRPTPGCARLLVNGDGGGDVLQGRSAAVEDRDLVAARAARPTSRHDVTELRVHLLARHQSAGQRMLELTDLGTLLDDIDDECRGRDKLRIDLLLSLAVRADGADER